jgi:hypothetical protein
VAVILLLGSAIYFFLLRDDGEADFTADVEPLDQSTEQLLQEAEESLGDMESTQSDQQTASGTPLLEEPASEPEQTTQAPSSQTIRQPEQEVVSIPPATGSRSADIDATSGQYLAKTRSSVQTVNSLISLVPANMSVTLLSNSGNRVRMEFVAQNQAEAGDFTGRLQQQLGGSGFKVISDNQVASNGGSVQKVLVSGRASSRSGSASGRIEYLNSTQASDWIKNTARQSGLSIIQLNTQQASFIEGVQKTPIFARLSGSKEAVRSMLDDLAGQNVNLELAKVILVSPDHIYYDDDTLVLVMNLFLYER